MSSLRIFDPSFNDAFEPLFRRFSLPARFDSEADALQIRVDVAENDNAYTVHADIPGVKKEDINVRIDGNIIQIDAETKHEKDIKEKGGKVLRSERHYGSISRIFSLAQDVDDTKAVAKYEHGVLSLALPKKAAVATKRIAVQ